MDTKENTQELVEAFKTALIRNEKSEATVKKYLHEIQAMLLFLQGNALGKEGLLSYRDWLLTSYKPQTVNVKLSAVNAFLKFIGQEELRVKFLKVQHRSFIDESREMSEEEYKRLLNAAKSQGNSRLYHIMLTICSTGIRIGELKFITVEAVRKGQAEIRLKGKARVILLPKELCVRLGMYAAKNGVAKGYIFRTRGGKPVDRSNIFHDMKALCETAKVMPDKVFPHNFRHLFARTYYNVEKNLAHLADVLGHSNIETTRIYVTASAAEYEKTLCRMHLVI